VQVGIRGVKNSLHRKIQKPPQINVKPTHLWRHRFNKAVVVRLRLRFKIARGTCQQCLEVPVAVALNRSARLRSADLPCFARERYSMVAAEASAYMGLPNVCELSVMDLLIPAAMVS